jgi:hypothetical protein
MSSNIEKEVNEDRDIEHDQPLLESELEFTHAGPAEQDYQSSEGAVELPEETESSDGLGLTFEDESDGNHEKDEDYRMETNESGSGSNEDSDGDIYLRDVHEAPKLQGKPKASKVCSFSHTYQMFFFS